MNVDWPRWIRASITKHFHTMLSDALIVDGQREKSNQLNDRYELRFNGPDIIFGAAGEYILRYFIQLLLTSVTNETDIYNMDRLKGHGANCFIVTIPIFKHGTSINDDGSKIGCVTLKSNLDIRDYGETVRQVTIDAMYEFEELELISTYDDSIDFDLELTYVPIDNGSIVYNDLTLPSTLTFDTSNTAILYEALTLDTTVTFETPTNTVEESMEV